MPRPVGLLVICVASVYSVFQYSSHLLFLLISLLRLFYEAASVKQLLKTWLSFNFFFGWRMIHSSRSSASSVRCLPISRNGISPLRINSSMSQFVPLTYSAASGIRNEWRLRSRAGDGAGAAMDWQRFNEHQPHERRSGGELCQCIGRR
jgi:hypothetical protein